MPKTLKVFREDAIRHAPKVNLSDLDFVLTERLQLTPSEYQLHFDQVLSPDIQAQFQKDLKKLIRGVSPQYIVGYAWFYGYRIKVQSGVLIPRFETEELVQWALSTVQSGQTVLDLGTGSGAITVALAKKASENGKSNLTFFASDITDQALRMAEENFLDYHLDVYIRKANVLIGLEKFDLIVSNPPYIKLSEKSLMDENVLRNEPKEALFGGEDGLDFYRQFADQVRDHLNPGGKFFLEFGFREENELKKLFQKKLPDFDLEFRKDMAGKPRMVCGRWQK